MPKNAVKSRFEGVFSIPSTCRKFEGKADSCYYYVIKVDGKRVWYKVGKRSEGYTAAMAHELRNAHIQGARHGGAIPARKNQGKGLTFAKAFEEYDKRHLSTLNSAHVVRLFVKKHILPVFEKRSMASITTLEIDEFSKRLKQGGLSPQTIVHILGYMNRIFKQTAAWEMHSLPSPVQGVKRPRIDNARMRYLTQAEVKILFADLKKRSPIWHDIAVISLTTGARLTEIRTLTVGSVNIQSGVMEVQGKTGRRMVQLSDAAIEIFVPRMENKNSSDLIFMSSTGGIVDISANSFKRAVIACNLNPKGTPALQRIVFHSLRHTFASWLAIAGEPILLIAELMGHSSLEMTKRYSHLCPDQKKAAVGGVSKIFQDTIPTS